jgi:mono/diheme cytochrome c family protein
MRVVLVPFAFALLPGLSAAADFVRDVRPVLAKHCVGCHGPDRQRGRLRLDTATTARKGGQSGPAVVPGKSTDSLLVRAVTGAKGVKRMPPKGPRLCAEDVAALKAWVDAGAQVPTGEVVPPPRSRHWAFRPVARPREPAVQDVGWVRNPIDSFILARLEKEGLKPSPEADRVTLLRRVSLDLTGLPPTPEEVKAFVDDKRPGAYERVVDRLLASPHYGERWGRHWLDQARYADSNGYSIDSPRSIWKYRDWVIDAFNADLPFDQFTVEQLAGDLLPNPTQDQKVATGFHRNTMINEEGGIDPEQFRVEAVVDRTNTTATVWLGLTLGCAQCHDHKFDPLSQRDYYRLYAFFNNSDDPKLDLATPQEMRRRGDVQKRVAALEKELKGLDGITPQKIEKWEGSLSARTRATLPKKIRDILAIAPNGRTPRQEQALLDFYRKVDQTRHLVGGLAGPFHLAAQVRVLDARRTLQSRIAALKKQLPPATTTMVLNERRTPRRTYVQLGGDFLRKGEAVKPGTPAVLPPLPAKGKYDRLDLARWLVDRNNPLTARVTVNRFWGRFFGVGLVETDNDFGTQGTPPSHPELLDWLASEFRDTGWGVKSMHRLIVTSATYRQSSHARPELAGVDPRNRLLARQNRLRLEAEPVRDAALAVSGLLNPKVGGPSVFPPQPRGVYSFTQVPKNWVASTGPDRFRRGMYTFFWRSAPHPGLVVFDAPDGTASCTRRNRSNTPLQALTLLNDQAFTECARAFADRVLRECKGDEQRIGHAFRLALGRQPKHREREILGRLLRQQRDSLALDPGEARALVPDLPKGADAAQHAAWTMVARVLLNVDEFITRE